MRCVLCARRNRVTDLNSGHVCVPCAGWLQVQVAEVSRLAADAAAFIAPGSSTGGGSRPVPGSRPPCRVDALDPWFTVVDGQELTVLECLELWERMVREQRGLSPYGPASAARSAVAARTGDAGYEATLTGVVRFLGAQVAWMTTEPDFPVDDFADEVTACVRVLRRWDVTAEERGQMVPCPTSTDDGDCGYRLQYRSMDEQVTCRRCGVTRDVSTLVLVALSDPKSDVWADPEAIARQFGVHESTLRKWARRGIIPRTNHGLYSVTAVANVLRGETA